MCEFCAAKLGKQDAKRIAAFAYHDFRPGKITGANFG